MLSKFKINEYLLLSIPILLISGPFLPDLVVCIFFLYSIYLIYNKKITINKNLKYFIFLFLLFYSFSLVSSFFSIEKFISLKSSLPYVRYLGFVIVLYYLFSKNHDIFKKLGLIILIISLLLLFDFVLLLFFGVNISGDQLKDQRFSSFFGSEEVMGSYIARLAPFIFISIFLINDIKVRKPLFIFSIFIIGFLILLSGERTALVSYSLLLLIIFLFFSETRKVLFTIFVFFILSIITLMFFFPNNNLSRPLERIVLHTMTQVYFTNQKLSFFSDRHLDHFKTSINIFGSNLFLGGGNKSFRFLCGHDEYTVRDDIINRNKEYAQFSDTLILEKSKLWTSSGRLDINFYIKYKNNEKYHHQKIVVLKNLKDLFKGSHYIYPKERFYKKAFDEKFLERLNNSKVEKGDFLFVNKAAIEFENGCNTHPHHIYLQIASENGIVNLIIIISLFIFLITSLIKIYFLKRRDANDVIIIFSLSMILIQIIPFIPHGNFFNNWLSVFFFFPFGAFLAYKNKQ